MTIEEFIEEKIEENQRTFEAYNHCENEDLKKVIQTSCCNDIEMYEQIKHQLFLTCKWKPICNKKEG